VEPDPTETDRLAAFEEGLRQGRAEVLAQAKQENAERRKLGVSLRQLDEEMTDRLSQQLSETVAVLCEATLAPAALDHEQLNQRCRKAAVLLGEDLAACTLHLHPDDVALLDTDPGSTWPIEADETLERGALRLIGREGEITDGPQEWRRSLAEALGLI
jgi:flagellar assembly protein FliH